MLEQKQGYTNWQHGQVYFSLSYQDAARYALNSFGSELLTECERYVKKVRPNILPSWYEVLRNKERRPIVIRVDQMTIDQLEPEVVSRGGIEYQLLKLTEAQRAALVEFKSVEAARAQLRGGSLETLSAEQVTLALSNCGATLEEHMRERLWAYFCQNTFRLKKGLMVDIARLEVISLD